MAALKKDHYKRVSTRAVQFNRTALNKFSLDVERAFGEQARIVVQESIRWAFCCYIASLPITTGLTQLAAQIRVHARGLNLKHHVVRNSYGRNAPILGWARRTRPNDWRTRKAYRNSNFSSGKAETDNFKLVLAHVRIEQADLSEVARRWRGIACTFVTRRMASDEPEMAAFIGGPYGKGGTPLKDYNVMKLMADQFLARQGAIGSAAEGFFARRRLEEITRLWNQHKSRVRKK